MKTSNRLASALARALLIGVAPVALIHPTVVAAQILPETTVMAMRLEGLWAAGSRNFEFTPTGRGWLKFRASRTQDGAEEARGVLQPEPAAGLLRGEVSIGPPENPTWRREMRAWVDDTGKLWIVGWNSEQDSKPVPATRQGNPLTATTEAWRGEWRTNRGLMTVHPSGPNFLAWITQAEGPRKDRVAMQGSATELKGAWDTRYKSNDELVEKPVQWGDLHLTLSPDGNAFSGWYNVNAIGAPKRVEWKGERVVKRTGPNNAQVLESARRLAGGYVSATGAKVTVSVDSNSLVGTAQTGQSAPEEFSLFPREGALTGQWFAPGVQGTLTLPVEQPADRLDGMLERNGSTTAYRLCRGPAGQTSLRHSGRGLWAEVAQTSVRRERDGSSSLIVGMRLLNAGASRLFDPGDLSVRLPEHSDDRPARAYYDPVNGSELNGVRRLADCGQAEVYFRFAQVDRRVRNIALVDAGGDTLAFDVSAATAGLADPRQGPVSETPSPRPPIVQTPASQPPRPQQPAPQPAPPVESDFAPLEKWDVRLDRVENPREDRLTHVYLTLRNSGTANLLQTQGVSVRHEGADGLVTESGQGLKAQPGYPELFGSPPPVVTPGRDIQTKFVFDRNGATRRVTVVEGAASVDFDF